MQFDNATNVLSKLGYVKYTIIKHIYENPGIRYREILKLAHISTFNQIVEYSKKTPSTISWYLKRLKHSGIITSIQDTRRHHLYNIANEELMVKMLYKYENNQGLRRVD